MDNQLNSYTIKSPVREKKKKKRISVVKKKREEKKNQSTQDSTLREKRL